METTGKIIDTGKNNKIRAVALDFDLITRSLDAQRAKAKAEQGTGGSLPSASAVADAAAAAAPSTVQPNKGVIENLANMLNVDLGGTIGGKKKDDDDLSRLTDGGDSSGAPGSRPFRASKDFKAEDDEIGSSILATLGNKAKESNATTTTTATAHRPALKEKTAASTKAPPMSDVRSKYADKLRKKLDGGLAGVESAKVQREESLKRGDAEGHLAARRIASAQSVGTGSKWLASTGTGNLLVYLTNRSVKIALLPLPSSTDEEAVQAAGERMDDLQTQLSQVYFSLLVKDAHLSPAEILANISAQIDVPSSDTIVVSDRDDYLREAKARGFYTCRIRPMNAPRGNVTTSYTVADVKAVEEVINELNGISFNTVFSGVGINHGGV